jgi:hypothetical protein
MLLTVGVEIVFWLLAVKVVALGWLVMLLVLHLDQSSDCHATNRIYASFVFNISYMTCFNRYCMICLSITKCYVQASAVPKIYRTRDTYRYILKGRQNINILQRNVLLYGIN